MEHPWDQQVWNEPVMYNEMDAHENPIMGPYMDVKDCSRNFSQNRHEPMEYTKNVYQPQCLPSRKSKHMEGKEEVMVDPSMFETCQADLRYKENEDSKSQYLYRKPLSNSPLYSSQHRHQRKYEKMGSDHKKPALHKHMHRQKIFDQERMPEDRMKVQMHTPKINKSSQSNRIPMNYTVQSPPPPPPYPHPLPNPLRGNHSRCHSHHRSKQHQSKNKQNVFCTSCVLCKNPNNYTNPCCLCELPVCGSCMKSNKNISNWRNRITCFMPKKVRKSKNNSHEVDSYDEESSSSSSTSCSKNYSSKHGRSDHQGYRKSYEKNQEIGYASCSSLESLKDVRRHRKETLKKVNSQNRSDHPTH